MEFKAGPPEIFQRRNILPSVLATQKSSHAGKLLRSSMQKQIQLMIYFQPGLYVLIEQLETDLAPVPKPLNHGFSNDVAYLVLGGFTLSESGDAFLVLSNDQNQIWFISNRHLRTYRLIPQSTAFRLRLEEPNENSLLPRPRNGVTADSGTLR